VSSIEQRGFFEPGGGRLQPLTLFQIQVPNAEFLAVHTCRSTEEARQQRLFRHLQREDGHRKLQFVRDVVRHVQRQRGLTHRGTCRENHVISTVESVGLLVESGKTRGEAMYALARIEKCVDPSGILVYNLACAD